MTGAAAVQVSSKAALSAWTNLVCNKYELPPELLLEKFASLSQ